MKVNKGLTLIELILYVAILSTFFVSVLTFVFSAVWGKEKQRSQTEVSDNINLVIKKLEYEINHASNITSNNQSSISIVSNDTSKGSAIFTLNSASIKYGSGNSGTCIYNSPCNLTSNLVNVTNFEIEVVDVNGSKVVNYKLDIEFNDSNNKKYSYSDSISGSLYLTK